MTRQGAFAPGGRLEDAQVHPPYRYPDYRSTARRAPHRPVVLLPH
ncbi:MAG: protocatechuate 3,4-dioxygenase subunit beta, partial [Acidimicrobiales bacterium]